MQEETAAFEKIMREVGNVKKVKTFIFRLLVDFQVMFN
jgi:hypothetical protein